MASPKTYIKKVAPIVQKTFASSGILNSVVIAQMCLESGYGTSELAVKYFNHLGLNNYHDGYLTDDATSVVFTVPQERNGKTIYQKEEMAVFPSIESCVKSMRKWYNRPKYVSLPQQKGYKAQAEFLEGRYATSSQYAESLCRIIEQYNLTQYDEFVQPSAIVYGVQLGAFTIKDNATRYAYNLSNQYNEKVDVLYRNGYYKVVMYLSTNRGYVLGKQKELGVGFVATF